LLNVHLNLNCFQCNDDDCTITGRVYLWCSLVNGTWVGGDLEVNLNATASRFAQFLSIQLRSFHQEMSAARSVSTASSEHNTQVTKVWSYFFVVGVLTFFAEG